LAGVRRDGYVGSPLAPRPDVIPACGRGFGGLSQGD
jgi:hypothetical protein